MDVRDPGGTAPRARRLPPPVCPLGPRIDRRLRRPARGGRAMTSIGTYTRAEAQLPQMLLWAAGIPYEVETADQIAASTLDITGGLRLLVEDRYAEDARSVLDYRPARKEQ